MRIVADENIPLLDEFFSGLGPIQRFPGRQIDAACVADADILLVRSVTRVNAELLKHSSVKFVGTCTIGTDHLDLDYLRSAGINWANAPGCNARGVVDYVLSSLLVLAQDHGQDLASRTFGVVGVGQVGGRLLKVLRSLGLSVLACDPVREAAEGGDYVSLEQVLAECDVISLHTPLTRSGAHPTYHLLDQARLQGLKHGTWLINASRGAVVDNQALRHILARRKDLQAVLDVWEGEPQADVALAQLCRISTPHIAGYSLDGKLRGTAQVYNAWCEQAGVSPQVQLEQLMPAPWLSAVQLDASANLTWALNRLCFAVYDPREDDANFRRSLCGDEAFRRAGFDALRKNYPVRREIDGLQVQVNGSAPALLELIKALGAKAL